MRNGMIKKFSIKPGMKVVARHAIYTRRLTVLSDEGGGWFMCDSPEHGKDLYHRNILWPDETPGQAE